MTPDWEGARPGREPCAGGGHERRRGRARRAAPAAARSPSDWPVLGVRRSDPRGVASVAANVAHSFVPPDNAPAWSPQPGAVAAAVVWPVALLVVVEILARVAWPAGRRWVALRYLGLLPVAAVAAGVSYGHMSGLLTYYGEPRLTAAFGPLAIDGLMIMASAALVATAPAVRAGEDRSGDSQPGSPGLPDLAGGEGPEPPAQAAAKPQAGLDLPRDLAAALDQLGLPRDAGREKARQALAAAGVPASTRAIAEAVRARKNGQIRTSSPRSM